MMMTMMITVLCMASYSVMMHCISRRGILPRGAYYCFAREQLTIGQNGIALIGAPAR
jgi:hypothetical protein